jgi:hypothetical protein
MPNLATSAALVDTATKCLATAAGIFQLARLQSRAVCALVIVSSVVKVFDEMMNSVSSASRSRRGFEKVRTVDVGNEAKGQVSLTVLPQRLVRHYRPQV